MKRKIMKCPECNKRLKLVDVNEVFTGSLDPLARIYGCDRPFDYETPKKITVEITKIYRCEKCKIEVRKELPVQYKRSVKIEALAHE